MFDDVVDEGTGIGVCMGEVLEGVRGCVGGREVVCLTTSLTRALG